LAAPSKVVATSKADAPVLTTRLAWATTIAVGAVAVCGFLPLGRSGETLRSSFQLVTVARQLEVIDGPAAFLAPLWYFVPAAAGLCFVGLHRGWLGLVATLGVVVGFAAVFLAWSVARSPLAPEVGIWFVGGAGVFALASGLSLVISGRTS